MSAINTGLGANAFKTALDLVFAAKIEYEQIPGLATAATPGVFVQDRATSAAVVTEQLLDSGFFAQKGELAVADEGLFRVGNQKTFTVKEWSQNLPISRTAMADQQHSVVNRAIARAAQNAKATQDKYAFSKYNLGFTTETTNDSVAVFSNSHTTLNGLTVDNLSTGALAESTLQTLWQLLVNQKTQSGVPGGYIPNVFLVPQALDKTAREVSKSTLRSGTGNNDMNYYSEVYPGLQVLNSIYLGADFGGSNTAYFLISKEHSMMRYVREGVNTVLVDWKTQANNSYLYKMFFREEVGALAYEGLAGATGL